MFWCFPHTVQLHGFRYCMRLITPHTGSHAPSVPIASRKCSGCRIRLRRNTLGSLHLRHSIDRFSWSSHGTSGFSGSSGSPGPPSAGGSRVNSGSTPPTLTGFLTPRKGRFGTRHIRANENIAAAIPPMARIIGVNHTPCSNIGSCFMVLAGTFTYDKTKQRPCHDPVFPAPLSRDRNHTPHF